MDLTRLKTNAEDTPWVSVSLEKTSDCDRHTGILYREVNQRLFQLHFGWHRRLYQNPVGGALVCAIPDFKFAEDQLWLAAFCAKVARNIPKNSIPYNLKYDEQVYFDRATGEFHLQSTTGLSCATFVVAVFRSAGHPIVDYAAGWPPANDDDKAAQKRFVDKLASSQDQDRRDQAAKIRGDIGCPRIRPDHVAGACLEGHSDRPVKHAECDANGKEVLSRLGSHLAAQQASPQSPPP